MNVIGRLGKDTGSHLRKFLISYFVSAGAMIPEGSITFDYEKRIVWFKPKTKLQGDWFRRRLAQIKAMVKDMMGSRLDLWKFRIVTIR
jgi:hypothetical protein